MPVRTVRARRLADGHFEFLEPVRLPAPEFDVVINEPPEETPRRPAARLSAPWGMGETGVVTRADLYDDIA